MSDDFGYVYLASTESYLRNQLVKVGVTNNIERRMRDLSSHSGVAEKFYSHSSFKFLTREDANRVERALLSRLTVENKRPNPNREFFKSNFSFSKYVREICNHLKIIALSTYHMENMYHDFALATPCAYFLLSDEVELEKFDDVMGISYQMFSSYYPKLISDDHGVLGLIHTTSSLLFNKKQFLLDNWCRPFITARARFAANERYFNKKKTQSRLVAFADQMEEIYRDKLDELFEFEV